jgi:hypothetical protein
MFGCKATPALPGLLSFPSWVQEFFRENEIIGIKGRGTGSLYTIPLTHA